MSKSNPTDKIQKILPGKKDDSGNTILHVLASGNEYAIYEIDHKDINYRLRIQIDGHTDDAETKLTDRFNLVKQKYIEAKGLLYRSSNYGMMKNRVAHTLASCLSSTKEPDGTEFDGLITTIQDEFKKVVRNKMFYFLPSTLLTIVTGFVFVCNAELRTGNSIYWQIIFILFSSLLGSSLSIFSRAKDFHFEEFPNAIYYIMVGFERIFLALSAGIIAYILIRSKFLFPQIVTNDYWKFMSLIVASAFSERLIPSMLTRIIKDKSKKKSSS